MINFGDVVVTGTGGSKVTFFAVSAPIDLKNKIQRQVSMLRGELVESLS